MGVVQMSPIRVLAFHTAHPHLGKYAGSHQVCRHFDPAQIDASLRPVTNMDNRLALPIGPLGRVLTNRISRGAPWYALGDLAAELRAIPACLTNTIDVVH